MTIQRANSISGVILAGGENRRFGGVNKSNILVGGSTIISRILDAISGIFGEIIIVTNNPGEFLFAGNCKIVTDQFRRVGPLGGIHSALKASSKDSVFIMAGDMPFLDKGLIMNQINLFFSSEAEAVLPRVSGCDEPLHAIYSKSLFGKLDVYLSANTRYAVHDFLKEVHVSYMDLIPTEKTKRAFTNINTPLSAEEANRLAQFEE